MGKNIYIGVDHVARKVKQPYIGVDNVARKVKTGYIGVDNVARQFFQAGTPMSSLAVGSSVYLNVGGVAREFLIVNQGKPAGVTQPYDDSCDGIWLLMKDCYEQRRFAATNNAPNYVESEIRSYLNSTFLGSLDGNIQSIIKQIAVPYKPPNTSMVSLPDKIFLLSNSEVGWVDGYGYSDLYYEYGVLAYFEKGNASSALNKRIAYLNGGKTAWWLRSFVYDSTYYPYSIKTDGSLGKSTYPNYALGIRPALVLPNTTIVNNSNFVIT